MAKLKNAKCHKMLADFQPLVPGPLLLVLNNTASCAPIGWLVFVLGLMHKVWYTNGEIFDPK